MSINKSNSNLAKYQSKLETQIAKNLKHIGLSKLYIDNPDKVKLLSGCAITGITTGATLGAASAGIGIIPGVLIGAGIGLVGGGLYIIYTDHLAKQAAKAETVIERIAAKNSEDLAKLSKADKKQLRADVAKLLAAEIIDANKELLSSLKDNAWNRKVVATELANRALNALNEPHADKDNYLEKLHTTKGTRIFKIAVPMPVLTQHNQWVNFSNKIAAVNHEELKEGMVINLQNNPHTFFKQPHGLQELSLRKLPSDQVLNPEPVRKLSG